MTTKRIHEQTLTHIATVDPDAFARLTLFPTTGGMETLDVTLESLVPHIRGNGALDTRKPLTVTATDGTTRTLSDLKQLDISYHVGRYETTSLAIALETVTPDAQVDVLVRLKSGKGLRYRVSVREFLKVSPRFDWFKPHARPVNVKTATGITRHPNGGRIRRVDITDVRFP